MIKHLQYKKVRVSLQAKINQSLNQSLQTRAIWYFDSGATKHITSQHSFLTSLVSAPTCNTITCANNLSYPIEGVGQIVLTNTNGSTFTLKDAL